MKSYAERKRFSPKEIYFWKRATDLIKPIPETFDGKTEVRCHELATAVGHVLGLPVVHGKCGIVSHSWLWTQEPGPQEIDLWENGLGWSHECCPKIHDVYTPGTMPQVLLIDTWVMLPHWRHYRIGSQDIDATVVAKIINLMSA